MAEVVLEWAGKDRSFNLSTGRTLDLQEACGRGIGAVFKRLGSGDYGIEDVRETIRHALVGGGMSLLDAKRLVEQHFDERPMIENHSVALEIVLAVMAGVKPSDDADPDSDETSEDGDDGAEGKIDFGDMAQIGQVFSLSPVDLRAMPYADYVNLVRGFAASQKRNGQGAPSYLSEEEFIAEVLNKYEPVD